MNREQFDAYVLQLGSNAARDPKGHFRKTAALAVLGFAYILLTLAVSIAIALGLIYLMYQYPKAAVIKLSFGGLALAGGLAWAIFRSLWVRLPEPPGRELTASEVPELFRLIDEVRDQLKAPPFDRVVLDPSYNAAITQTPRLGLLGWHRNHLILGLPLLQGLSTDEFKGVLAHEYGHLSGQHGRFGNWLYRLRRTWLNTIELLNRQNSGVTAKPLIWFLNWYWPKFNGYAFVLSRSQEYEADAGAARLVGASVMSQALARVAIQAQLFESDFWENIGNRSKSDPTPPIRLFQEAKGFLTDSTRSSDLAKRLKSALTIDTTSADTHPCLRERLAALRLISNNPKSEDFPETIAPPIDSAAQTLLAMQEAKLALELGETWARDVSDVWKSKHAEAIALRDELESKSSPSAMESTSVDSLWERARLFIQLEGTEKAAPLLEKILSEQLDHAGAAIQLGSYRIASDDPTGETLLRQAILSDLTLIHAAAEHLSAYYSRHGKRDELAELTRQLDAAEKELSEAQFERSHILSSDSFSSTELTKTEWQQITSACSSEPSVQSANIAQKEVTFLKQHPCRVLVLHHQVPWWKFESYEAQTALAGRVLEKITLRGYLLVVVARSNPHLAKSITRIPNSLVNLSRDNQGTTAA